MPTDHRDGKTGQESLDGIPPDRTQPALGSETHSQTTSIHNREAETLGPVHTTGQAEAAENTTVVRLALGTSVGPLERSADARFTPTQPTAQVGRESPELTGHTTLRTNTDT